MGITTQSYEPMQTSPPEYKPGEHPSLPPPRNLVGPVKWAKDNLFGSVTNTILTIVAVYLLYLIVPAILDYFFFNAAFEGSSRAECREIAKGACWAFIDERISVFTYGFYPVEERWRPNIAFILLFVALAPILFDKVPYRSKLIVFSMVYPLLAVLLIVGPIEVESMHFTRGVSGPLTWLVIFAAAAALAVYGSKTHNALAMVVGIVPAGFVLVAFFLSDALWISLPDSIGLTNAAEDIYIFEPVDTHLFGGVLLTIIIGVTGITLSLPIGIVLALGRYSNLPAIKTLCIMFIEFIRGVPLITLLFVASTMLSYFLPPGTDFDLLLRVLIMVTLFASAYMAEVIRGGLQSLPKGQFEAADAMGLKYWQTMRLIILPQALKVSIPGIVNTFIGLYKDTTLVLIIGLLDILGVGKTAISDPAWNGLSTEVYVFVALFFFVSCFGMSRYSLYLERKLHTGHKR
ncbi:MAG: amino acid ABC transporter permease [Alphaproteobacteria bacterium]|uniref:amino acid ABC transporter permease n=1 Tax=Pacificispira sp. TaxID=2888761 RepID=UPI00330019D2